jgi:pimeloyl-ACP methyl ester carboxylesterase
MKTIRQIIGGLILSGALWLPVAHAATGTGISPIFTLDTRGVGITTPPQSQTVAASANVTFAVAVAGVPPFSYQWLFNGQTLAGQTAARLSLTNVQFANAGGYSVVVTNAYGSVTSAVAQLTVFTPLTLTPTNRVPTNEVVTPFIPTNHLKVFSGGKFQSGIALNPSRMTIVMTHGFMGSPNDWATNMATYILAHVSVSTPNIVAWDWSSEAGTNLADLPVVSTKVLGQGFALATNLLAALGTSYSQPIHFIGHSLGTLVNSAAANYLQGDAPNNAHQYFNPTNTQMTLFDEAEAGPQLADALVALQNHQQDVRVFYDTPIPARAAWIDNYISAFGLPHPEAANVILTKGAIFVAPDLNSFINAVISFHGYPYVWYDDSVTNSTGSSALMGYRWSFEKNNLSGMPATNTMFIQTSVNPELTLQQTNFDYGVNVLIGRLPVYVGDVGVSVFAAALNNAARIVGQVTGSIWSTTGMIINLVTGGGGSSQIQSLDAQPMGGPMPLGGSAANTPAYAWIPLAVPPNTVSMSFDFMLQGNGSNDNFEVALNGTNVLSLATSMIQTNVTLNSGLIGVSQYAGTNVELFLGIVGGTSTNASLTASDFYFYSAAQPSLQAQVLSNKLIASWSLSAAAFTLQTSTNLTATNSWTTVTNVPAIVNLQNAVTNPISGGMRFYRLKQ